MVYLHTVSVDHCHLAYGPYRTRIGAHLGRPRIAIMHALWASGFGLRHTYGDWRQSYVAVVPANDPALDTCEDVCPKPSARLFWQAIRINIWG